MGQEHENNLTSRAAASDQDSSETADAVEADREAAPPTVSADRGAPSDQPEGGTMPPVLHRMSADELRTFVLDVLAGQVFTSAQIPGDAARVGMMLPMVFMPLAFGALSDWPEDLVAQIGVLYADVRRAMPRSINGMPVFSEMRVMHKDDWDRARAALQREADRLSKIDV